MRTTRSSSSRQRACKQCSTAKARCDRNPNGCTRCAQRALSCSSVHSKSSSRAPAGASIVNNIYNIGSSFSASNSSSATPFSELISGHTNDQIVRATSSRMLENSPLSRNHQASHAITEIHSPNSLHPHHSIRGLADAALDFSNVELVCPIDGNDICIRWLNPSIPTSGETIKTHPTNINAFTGRILKSYAAIIIRGRGVPPFVHSTQLITSSPPLSACFSLVKICNRPVPGSENILVDVLHREMETLYDQHGTLNDMDLFAAFQAYLIYTMVLFFQLDQGSTPSFRRAMMNLQELARASSEQGLVCTAEQDGSRPVWESWIVAEAKRRTLYTMYLFDDVLAAQDTVPTFLGTKIQGLPAPADRVLWEAQTRTEWEIAYNTHLAEWSDGGLRIDEFWPTSEGMDEATLNQRRTRVDDWLQSIDEFGMMLFAATSYTDGR